MTLLKNSYPQEWPSHLSTMADVEVCNESPPAGYHGLLFEKLDWKPFEQLCWWLIQKDHELVGCQLAGGKGRSQDGVDLFALDRLDPNRLVVFQCKCWADFPTTKLKLAVDKFLNGAWAKYTHRFVLVIAQPELGKLADQWHKEEKRLREAGIVGEVWSGIDLTYQVRRFPDIVWKFFPGAATPAFCNEWMQKVGFYERLQKALVDPRPEVAQIAKDFVIQTPSSESIETRSHENENWTIKRPWVYASAILPSCRFPIGSAMLNIHKPDVDGVMVVLSQKWLCSNFLGSIGAPLSQQYRPFISGEISDENNSQYVIDLVNCRFTLSEEWVQELAYLADELSIKFFSALVDLERRLGAEYFPFVDNNQIALCTMPKWLWKAIIEFANEHDYARGTSDWHMFDGASGSLKPCVNRPHPKYDQGYHSIFYAKDDVEELVFGDEVLVVWSPPSGVDEKIQDRKWWSCDYAHRWLKDDLLPEVEKWLANKQRRWPFLPSFRMKKFKAWWVDHAKLDDVRKFPLAQDNRYRTIGLVKTVEEMQVFFHGHGPNQRIYLPPDKVRALYVALMPLIEGKRGYPGYIAGNLSLGGSCDSHEKILTQLSEKIKQDNLTANSAVLDYYLRAMLEVIDDDEGWIDPSAKESLFYALMPLMKFFDQEMLILRHCKWI